MSQENGTATLARRSQIPAMVNGQMTVAVMPGDAPGDEPQTAVLKMTANGLVKQTLSHVRVSERKGHVYGMSVRKKDDRGQWKNETRPVLTAAGYEHLNQFLGITFISPPTVAGPDGRPVGNPYVHVVSGEIEYVKVRRVGIGRNAIGNLVIHDRTVTYSLSVYFAEAVYAKWNGKYNDAAPQGWAQMFATGKVPADVTNDPHVRLLECPGGVTLALDLRNRDVHRLFSEHITRQKFADRHALTICDRNILKHMTGISVLERDATVPVVSWQQADMSIEQLNSIADQLNAGETTVRDINGTAATIDSASDVVQRPDDESVVATMANDPDIEPSDPDEYRPDCGDHDAAMELHAPPPDTSPDDAPVSAADKSARCNEYRVRLREACRRLGTEPFFKIAQEVGIRNGTAMSACTDPDTLKELLDLVEQSKGGAVSG